MAPNLTVLENLELIAGIYGAKEPRFYPASMVSKALPQGEFSQAMGNLVCVTAWAAATFLASVLVFTWKIRKDNA